MDFERHRGGVVEFAAGETAKTITVDVLGDTVDEDDETFVVTLSNASDQDSITTATATGTIVNDDDEIVSTTTELRIASAAAISNAGDFGTTELTITVSRSGATDGQTSVDYAVTGSGSDPATASDFDGIGLPDGTVTYQLNQNVMRRGVGRRAGGCGCSFAIDMRYLPCVTASIFLFPERKVLFMLKTTFTFVCLLALISPLVGSSVIADETTNPSLAPQLNAIAEGAAKRFPAEVLATFKIGIETVRQTGIEDSAKQVGDLAVDAKLTGWDGSKIQLSELWKEGPVVLLWYRGGWCPYCNVQLRAMQQQLAAMENAGAKLIVLTPELPTKARQTAEANELSLVAVHDQDNALAKQYGIVFDLPPPIVPMYRDQLKLGTYNGNDQMQLPLAATYVIDRSGKITYAFLDVDYTKRAEPAEVMKAVISTSK